MNANLAQLREKRDAWNEALCCRAHGMRIVRPMPKK